MEPSLYSVNLTRVNQPGKVCLELKGSILIIHKENWVSKYSLYVPIEVVNIEEEKHRNYRKLWESILGFMLAFLLCLPLSLWFIYKPLFYPYDLLWAIPLIALFLFTLMVGFSGFFRFIKLYPAISLIFHHRSQMMKMSFWVKPDIRMALEKLIARIHELKKILETEGYIPLKVCPMWFHSKPYRKSLVMGFAVSFVLFCIITVIVVWQVAGEYGEKIWWAYSILPFPPFISVIGEYIRRKFLWGVPKGFKKVRNAFEKENYSSAITELQELLKEQPDLGMARFLLIQLLTEKGEYDNALKHCEEFYFQEPSLATEMKTTIWWLRCVQERMEHLTEKSQDTKNMVEE
ncbi:MAG: tetratricopeptide repeat protein [Candidatus Hydrogenedens sp.]